MATCVCQCGHVHDSQQWPRQVTPARSTSGYQCGWCHQRHVTLDGVKNCRSSYRVRSAAEMRVLGEDLLRMSKELP